MRLYLAESVDPLSCHRFRLLIDNFWFAQGSLRKPHHPGIPAVACIRRTARTTARLRDVLTEMAEVSAAQCPADECDFRPPPPSDSEAMSSCQWTGSRQGGDDI